MEMWRHAAAALVTDLHCIFNTRLRSVVAYGLRLEGGNGEAPVTCLALVDSLTIHDLEACARSAPAWERHGLAIPLLLPLQEFQRSLDVFPLEYGEIIRAHERVFGPDPFEGATIARDDLRRACETQIKSHLVHLREGFIEAAGGPQAIADLVTASAPGFAALLRNVARLSGSCPDDRRAATRAGAHVTGLPETIVENILALERQTTMPTSDAARLFAEYLAAVEQLAHTVDTWRG